MSSLTGYEFREPLHDGRNTFVYRAVRESDEAPVVLKILKKAYASELLPRFKREFEIAASLNGSAPEGQRIDGVVKVLMFETVNDLPAIVMEDFGGVSLNFNHSVWSLDDFFPLALQVVDMFPQTHHVESVMSFELPR